MRPSYQTVRLTKGKHSSPDQGVCVMELASMLAGEPFSDHPRCVSGSIAALLRGYNDILNDERRQDLYEYAARTIGTTGSELVERARRERLVEWGEEVWRRRPLGSLRARLRPESRTRPRENPEAAARHALHAIRRVSDAMHEHVLALVDELIDMRDEIEESRQPRGLYATTHPEDPSIPVTANT